MSGPASRPAGIFLTARWGGSLGEQENQIYLSHFVFQQFKLRPGSIVLFKVGSLYRKVHLDLVHCNSNTSEPIIFLSPDLAGSCQIPTGLTITLKYSEAGLLCAGPLIGLLSVRDIHPDSQFGGQEPVLAALADSAPKLSGMVFVFCPEDINWDMSSVTGYVPVPEQETQSLAWKPLNLPIPDVIYDRIPTRSMESRPEVLEAKSWLMMQLGLPFFNTMFLDKWQTHVALQSVPEVAGYLPPTRFVESPEDIREFIDIYRSVFLKPSAGSLGRRIINIRLGEENRYYFRYRSRDRETIEGQAEDFTSLSDTLKQIMGKKAYIIQKDLELAKFEDRPFDIRVLAQKDRWGNWRRTKIYVREAATGSFLSNLSDGAQPKSISTVLRDVFQNDFQAQEGLGEEIRQAVRIIPPALETGTGMTWAELGIDLGIDDRGKVWLIEVNSKPFRTLVSKTNAFRAIEKSLMRPLEFAKFLAGFYRHSPNGFPDKGGNPGANWSYTGHPEHSPGQC